MTHRFLFALMIGIASLAHVSLARADGITSIFSSDNGKCVDVSEISNSPGAKIHQWSCWGGLNQNFIFTASREGSFSLQAQHSKLCVDSQAAADGQQLVQNPCNGSASQKFFVTQNTDGSYLLKTQNQQSCLENTGLGGVDGSPVGTGRCTGGRNQNYRLTNPSVLARGSAAVAVGQDLFTNFGLGVNLQRMSHEGYDPATGRPLANVFAASDEYALLGQDLSTGFVFGPQSPQLWGGKDGNRAYAAQFQQIANVKNRLAAGQPFLTPSQLHTLEILSHVPGPLGVETSVLHHNVKAPYFDGDQSPYVVHPDVRLPQGMYYIRYWFKLLPGFTKSWGSGYRWYGLTEFKNDSDNNRAGVNLILVNGKPKIRMTIDNMRGGTLNGVAFKPWEYLYPEQSGPSLEEGVWYRLEFAARTSNTKNGGGFVWAALNGQQFAYQAGQNIFDGGDPKLNRIFVTMFYGNAANPGLDTYVTDMSLWETWPPDASTHP